MGAGLWCQLLLEAHVVLTAALARSLLLVTGLLTTF